MAPSWYGPEGSYVSQVHTPPTELPDASEAKVLGTNPVNMGHVLVWQHVAQCRHQPHGLGQNEASSPIHASLWHADWPCDVQISTRWP